MSSTGLLSSRDIEILIWKWGNILHCFRQILDRIQIFIFSCKLFSLVHSFSLSSVLSTTKDFLCSGSWFNRHVYFCSLLKILVACLYG